MNTQTETGIDREAISALMDGQSEVQSDDADPPDLLRQVETDAGRESWLLYHLIGDVMRSPDLARGYHDLTLAARVSQRLNDEPAQADELAVTGAALGAGRTAAANDGVFRWKMVAGLTSCAAVAAIGWVVLAPPGDQPAATRQVAAQSIAPAAPGMVAVSASLPALPAVAAASAPPVMWRDPRLDAMLEAHRAAAGGSTLGNTAGYWRNVTFEEGGRH
jgi:sigma-E factor negative regulatory protein RseA